MLNENKQPPMSTVDDTIEIEGANENEALDRACEALNTKLENLGYEILESGSKGLMGLMRGKKVKLRAWRKDERGEASLTDPAAFAKASLKEILKHICEDFAVDVKEQPDCITLLVDCDEGGLVIGKNGQTLDALQYILRRMVLVKFPIHEKQLIVDTEGYRERKRDSLEAMAKRLAKKVRATSHKEVLQPMNAYDRRLVHMALKEESGVVSRSQGEGFNRCIVIYPENAAPEPSSSDSSVENP